MLLRRVDVHDERDVVDVDAARRDVGRDEDANPARGERGEVLLSSWLRQVAVQLSRGDPRARQMAGELFGAVLCTSEQQRAIDAARELCDHCGLVAGLHSEQVTLEQLDR